LRRLDAEALRDAMLAVSGELDRRISGPYVPTRRTAEGSVEVEEKQVGARRRSVYLQQRRTQVATLLHTLGLDHRRLTHPHDGRLDSLTDAEVSRARVTPKLLA
jgi:hypothetical protein